MSKLFVEFWGTGTPVVLVHGSLATGAEEWQAQRPLADEGYRLLVVDRRGYGQSPAAEGEDFLRDAEDIADLMGDGAHLVGHSYGGLSALFAAAHRPAATRSLALLEPGTFALGQHNPAARTLVEKVRRLWDEDLPDEDLVIRFLKAVGSDPDALPPELIAAAVPLVPVFRHGRPVWYSDLPLAELAAARFPRLVSPVDTAVGSTRYAMISLNASVRLGQSLPVQVTRFSSPDRLSTSCCWHCGGEQRGADDRKQISELRPTPPNKRMQPTRKNACARLMRRRWPLDGQA